MNIPDNLKALALELGADPRTPATLEIVYKYLDTYNELVTGPKLAKEYARLVPLIQECAADIPLFAAWVKYLRGVATPEVAVEVQKFYRKVLTRTVAAAKRRLVSLAAARAEAVYGPPPSFPVRLRWVQAIEAMLTEARAEWLEEHRLRLNGVIPRTAFADITRQFWEHTEAQIESGSFTLPRWEEV